MGARMLKSAALKKTRILPDSMPSTPMRQLILDLLPVNPPSLDNFVAGGNGEALAIFTAWLAGMDGTASFHFWGEAGAGKSHLLSASTFTRHDAADDPALTGCAEIADNAQVAIDQVDLLDATGQIALFNLFNRLKTGGGRLLTAATQPPAHLNLREDLRTRLGSGHICRLHPLSDQEKLAALAAQSRERAMKLPPEWLDYLLRHAPRDMRSLSGLIVALDRYSLEHKRAITMPLLREVLHAPPR